MTRARLAAAGLLALLTCSTLVLSGAPRAAAATRSAATPSAVDAPAQTANPAEKVLAIVSPIASPACSASGLATLLVPVVGGLLTEKAHLPPSVKVGDVILNALGPVFVMCGTLPAAKGSQCEIDRQATSFWPAELNTFGLTPPSPLGIVTDTLDAAMNLLGLPPLAALENALQCTVPPPAGAPDPVGVAAAPAAAPATPSTGDAGGEALPAVPTGGGPLVNDVPADAAAPADTAPSATPTPAATTPAPRTGLIRSLVEDLPGPIRALQFVVAAVLAAFLAMSWLTAWRTKVATRRK
ncbi:MAG TPA: hypothetical protein VHA73_12280 [Acidimicrobiales bacterium]|nr:hypothetical protein [Acidimicrobiales bacterium]